MMEAYYELLDGILGGGALLLVGRYILKGIGLKIDAITKSVATIAEELKTRDQRMDRIEDKQGNMEDRIIIIETKLSYGLKNQDNQTKAP